MFSVWTKNCNETYSIMTDWQSYSACKKMIVGRWGHWPCWAYISKAQNTETFKQYNGE